VKLCSYCGRENEDTATRCARCGTEWQSQEAFEAASDPLQIARSLRAVGWILCFLAVAIACRAVGPLVAESKLLQDAATTSGVITYRKPGTHRAVHYSYVFKVRGQNYRGRDRGESVGWTDEFRTPVTVYYSRSDPTISSLHAPAGRISWERVLSPLAVAAVAFCVARGWIDLTPLVKYHLEAARRSRS
jgi:hypothetical protein